MNLFGNAVKHSPKEGIINIRLRQGYLGISNTGSPLSVPSDKLFERFYKIDKSTVSQGLGLAIVKEICRLNRWEISYEYKDDQHTFKVKF